MKKLDTPRNLTGETKQQTSFVQQKLSNGNFTINKHCFNGDNTYVSEWITHLGKWFFNYRNTLVVCDEPRKNIFVKKLDKNTLIIYGDKNLGNINPFLEKIMKIRHPNHKDLGASPLVEITI